ncbi:MAG TPA: MmcQ/YjbR family DNA-binding protein, partial [Bacteroidales bacterium]|nr:MmcQ/YjbR family DNA-binding protein [Bacteroidales bacterium]
ELREKYSSILPGYYMSKKHWNTILLTSELKDDFILSMVLDSYYLVVKSLPKKQQLLCVKK